MIEGKHGGVFDMETLFVYRSGEHVVVYRSVEELLGIIRASITAPVGTTTRISVDVLRTAVEQRSSQVAEFGKFEREN